MSKSNTCLCYTYVRIYKEYVNSVKWPMSVVSPTVTSRDFYLHDYVTLLATWPFFGEKCVCWLCVLAAPGVES